jgi:hypothetical protein
MGLNNRIFSSLILNYNLYYDILFLVVYLHYKCTKKISIMIQEIIAYQNLLGNIDELMNKSPYKKGYIIEQIGMPNPTFYRKLKSQSFTANEMLEIAKILSPEEYYLMELKESIQRGKDDFKNGRFTAHENIVNEIRKELNMK